MQHRAHSLIEIKSLDAKRRAFVGWATTPALDRVNDSINPLTAKFTNPTVLLHQHKHDLPIGTVRFKQPTNDGIPFEAEIPTINEPGLLKDRTDLAWSEVAHGLVKGVSIGFRATEAPTRNKHGGLDYDGIEIMELSTVSVPANSQCSLQVVKSIDAQVRAAMPRDFQIQKIHRTSEKSPVKVVSTNTSTPATDFLFAGKCLMAGVDGIDQVRGFAEAHGGSARLLTILKENPLSIGDANDIGLTSLDGMRRAFFEALSHNGVFFRLLQNGIQRVPLKTPITLIGGNASAFVIGEGQVKPVTSVTISKNQLDNLKAAAIVVASKELAANFSSGGQTSINNALRNAVAAAADEAFFAACTVAATFSSTGGTEAAMKADLRNLLAAVTLGSASRAFLIFGTNAIKRAILMDPHGTLSLTGGAFFGIDSLVSSEIDANTVRLIDASGFAGDTDTVTLNRFNHASIQLSATPDSPATASTVTLNLWQQDLVALRAEAFFGVEQVRDNAVADITGIYWGSPDSPA